MPDTASTDGPPPFDDPFSEDDVEQRIYGTILQTREPTTASAIAERAECDPKTTRKYLSWFGELGIVIRHDGHPATYKRNNAYFEWRRINRLATNHSVKDLQQHVEKLTTHIDGYEEVYDAKTPAAVHAVEVAETSEKRTIDNVYSDLADWATAHEERTRYERARLQRASTDRQEI
ncbi:sugar-specific transcriptional regulator TrmB [Halomicroarcula sp. GCM10025324]|uniref:DUF7342 family protein n=1 Tax=Haloarcula TaxID=2237 RepID=UPI0023E7DCF4|nr:sugar-specific transcriptional regulator TrmB [Halomicroarcula sp. ZS-22-S1]